MISQRALRLFNFPEKTSVFPAAGLAVDLFECFNYWLVIIKTTREEKLMVKK
jgi:hypothetical protein